MNLKEIAEKSGISEKTLSDLFPKIGVTETDYNDDHVKILDRIKTIKDGLPEGTEPAERARIAIQQFNAEQGRNAIALRNDGQIALAEESLPPNIIEDMEGLAEKLVSENIQKDTQGLIEGAVDYAYKAADENALDAHEQGAQIMDRIMTQKRLQHLSSPEHSKKAHDFFLQANSKAQAAREGKKKK
jgi:hypothetical protein